MRLFEWPVNHAVRMVLFCHHRRVVRPPASVRYPPKEWGHTGPPSSSAARVLRI